MGPEWVTQMQRRGCSRGRASRLAAKLRGRRATVVASSPRGAGRRGVEKVDDLARLQLMRQAQAGRFRLAQPVLGNRYIAVVRVDPPMADHMDAQRCCAHVSSTRANARAGAASIPAKR